MTSMPINLLRLTGPGLAIVAFLLLWLFARNLGIMRSTQRRRTRRHAILLPVEVEGAKALTQDISLEGCRLNGNLPIRAGQHLTLRLHLPGKDSPLVVDQAVVRWTRNKDAGFQFMSLSSSKRERLGALLRQLA